jgi:UDP-4-amino-4,6-dideoxy-N-acetyl-beta-L-altrosamine N-acetyltransferase
MKLFKYGIILERLKEADIELVRQWRNSDPVRLNMEFQEIISPEQQIEWFKSIDNLQNNYLMIHYKGEKIGLLNDKNVDWEARTSESGLFLGRTEFYATFVPYLVSIAGIETTFYFLNWQKQFAHILRTNLNAINYNKQLGYSLCDDQEAVENQQYELTRESFEQKAGKIRKAVRLLAGDDVKTRLLLEPADYISGLAQRFESLLRDYPHKLNREETKEGIWYREF